MQNTAWRNVELALEALRFAGALNLASLRAMSPEELERLIRPAGFFRQKARSLKSFVAFLDERYRGSLSAMFSRATEQVRGELLSIRGIGLETADSILLYAGQHAVFVVDAYARRVLARHQVLPSGAKYEEIRGMVEGALAVFASEHPMEADEISESSHRPSAMSRANRSPLAQVYNEMHGLMVAVGKRYCLKRAPLCEQCPLQKFLPIR